MKGPTMVPVPPMMTIRAASAEMRKDAVAGETNRFQ